MRGRGPQGFTVTEMVVVLALFGTAAMIAIPRVSESLSIARVDRASRTVMIDLEQAVGLAARQRAPVTVRQPAGSMRIVVEDAADGTVYWTTDLGDGTLVGTNVGSLALNPTNVTVFPTGMTSAPLTVTLEAAGHSRTVTMSQAAQIRLTQ